MYKTRNMELVVNDSILSVAKKAGVHLSKGTCVYHGEDTDKELRWSLWFADYQEAIKFYDMYRSEYDQLAENVTYDYDNVVGIHICSSDVAEFDNYKVALQTIRVELETEYLFITEYLVDHKVKLHTTKDEDYLTLIGLGENCCPVWDYADGCWVSGVEVLEM